jgi:hypothetical protein
MNDSSPDPLLDPLFARARAHRPDTGRAEYAFETRLLARLREAKKPVSAWGLVSWRMIPLFAVLVLGLAVWQIELGPDSQEAAQVASLQNPEAADLVASFSD